MQAEIALDHAERLALVGHAQKWFMDALHPLQIRMDEEDWFPREAYRDLARMGLLGITVAQEHGGQGLDYLTAGMICEAMAMANPALAFSWVSHDNLCLNSIFRNGSPAQRERFVGPMCRGEMIGGLAMTEPGAGSDALGSMRTRARRDGDRYILNGRKIYITNGPVADVLIVYARTAEARGSRGISAFLVETGAPGFAVASRLDKMGFRGSPLGELVFEDCEVPIENLLGVEGGGHVVMMSGLDLERAMSAPLCLGPAQRAFDLALEHSTLRQQFDAPIASFQLVQSKLAEMYVALETARTFLHRVLTECETVPHEAAGRGEIHKLSAAALFQAARAGSFVLDEALQIHGGYGYMRDTEINRLYRTGKAMEIAAGTQEIRKLIIARELLNGTRR